ncbi:MAG: crossover junction endodeoxyribonuclease RuvC [Ectothiorhodospiraceae bacterium]|nr:crossover junction endodeoxyribonuclease RuvC [Ectothiorhodospiraceae bacterium]
MSGDARVLGVDPGSRITGWGVVDFVRGRARHVASGCVATPAGEFPARLLRIHQAIGEVVDTHGPSELAIERVFVHRNVDSALKLGQARGVALVAAASRGLEVFEYMPNEIKQAVTGRGHAGKEQIQHMVRVLLALTVSPAVDEADALAVALCHGHRRETGARLAAGASTGAAPLVLRRRRR